MHTKILVTGAPGNVGSEVVRLLQAQKIPCRIGAWNVAQAQQTFGEDADVVAFDFLQPQTFPLALQGIRSIFLVRPPALADVPREIAPLLYAAVGAGVEHIVFLSLQGVEQNPITPHYKIEQLIRTLPLQYTFLRASFFMQNLSTTHLAEIRDEAEIALPMGVARTSFIDVRDIAAVAVQALTQSSHRNQAYTLTGSESLTYQQVATTLSSELGRKIRYHSISAPHFFYRLLRRGQKASFALVVTALYLLTRRGNAAEVTPDVERILGKPPIEFAQFVRDYRQVWRPT